MAPPLLLGLNPEPALWGSGLRAGGQCGVDTPVHRFSVVFPLHAIPQIY